MVDKEEEEGMERESSLEFERTQSHAELRRRAKENLEKAERVLAESGNQLSKNKKSQTRYGNQGVSRSGQSNKENE